MDLITDGLLIAGTVFAGLYCWVLSGRVRALKSLDSGLGGAIVTLTRQIELARTTLDEARRTSGDSARALDEIVTRSEGAARQLRLLLAAAAKDQGLRTARSAAIEPTAYEPAAREPAVQSGAPEPVPAKAPARQLDLRADARLEPAASPRIQQRAEPEPEAVAEDTSGPLAMDQAQDRPEHPPAPAPEAAAAPQQDAADPAPAWAAAQLDILASRRRKPSGPRLVALPQIRAAQPEADRSDDTARAENVTLPKPRKTPPVDGILRRRTAAEPPVPHSEEDLLAALTAFAAGGER